MKFLLLLHSQRDTEDQMQNLIQLNLQRDEKSKILPMQYIFLFFGRKGLTYCNLSPFRNRLAFLYGDVVSPSATSRFNYSSFKTQSCVAGYQRQRIQTVYRTHKMISAAAFTHTILKRQDNLNPPTAIIPIHNRVSLCNCQNWAIVEKKEWIWFHFYQKCLIVSTSLFWVLQPWT